MKETDKHILNIALPSIVSNITVPLLGLVDVTIVGHLGNAAYIGAIAVGSMLFNIIYWLFAFLRMGTSGMTAQLYGKQLSGDIVQMAVRSIGIGMAASIPPKKSRNWPRPISTSASGALPPPWASMA